jgi:hypothetical protein
VYVHVTVCVRRERVCMCMCIYCMCLVGRDFVRGRESKRMCVLSSPSVSSFLHLVPILHTTCPLPLRTPLTFPIPSHPILSYPILPFTPQTSLTFPLSTPRPSLLPRSYHSPLPPPLHSLLPPSLSISTSLLSPSLPPLPSLLPRSYPISRGQIPYLGSQRRIMWQDKENYRKR